MVIFSDGEDTHNQLEDKNLDDVVQAAVDAQVPVYLVRTNYDKKEGQIIPDEMWIPAIERTGGKFYAASSEAALLAHRGHRQESRPARLGQAVQQPAAALRDLRDDRARASGRRPPH